jgi:hypothetical protein
VNLEFRLLLTEDYYIAIQSHGALSQVATDTNLLVLELQRPSTNDKIFQSKGAIFSAALRLAGSRQAAPWRATLLRTPAGLA